MRKTKDEIIAEIQEYFENNMDVFADCIEELDGYNGYLDDDRLYPMYELDMMLEGKTPTEIIDLVNDDFSTNDEYFYYDIYGLKSTDDREGHYEDFLNEYAIERMADYRRWVDTIDRTAELCELYDEYENADCYIEGEDEEETIEE